MTTFHMAARFLGDDITGFRSDQIASCLLGIALIAAVISGFALLAGLPLRRRPALRHAILLAGLICLGLLPIFTILAGFSKNPLIQVNLPFPCVAEPLVRVNDRGLNLHPGTSELVGRKIGRFDAPSLPGQPGAGPPAAESHVGSSAGERSGRHPSPVRPAWFHVGVKVISLIWAAGSLNFLIRFVLAWIQAAVICRRLRPLPDDACREMRSGVMDVMGGCRLPEIFTSSDVRIPLVTGLIKPRIVLPNSFLNLLNSDETQEILIHETAHAIRRDLWVIHLEALIVTMYWPIPLVSRLVRELSGTREELCDLFVLKRSDRHQYGRTLLNIARIASGARPLPLAAGVMHRRGALESRIARLLDCERNESNRISWFMSTSILTAFVFMTGVACSARLIAGNGLEPGNRNPPIAGANGVVVVEQDAGESMAASKLELLGGNFERNENLRARPIVSLSFSGSRGFNDNYAHLLRPLKNLSKLDLSNTQITYRCLKEVGELKNLTELNLCNTRITDAGVRQLQNLGKLTWLTLSDTEVTDEGLAHIKTLRNLERLELQKAKITGVGLKHLADLKNLKALDLHGSQLSDQGMKELRKLDNLTMLYLNDTRITDVGLLELSEFRNLWVLGLDRVPVTDAGMPALRNLSKLKYLYLSQTRITDAGLKELGGLQELTTIDLSLTQITDAGLKELDVLPKLTAADFHQTAITGNGLIEWEGFRRLTSLNIFNDSVTESALKELKRLSPKVQIKTDR